MKITRIHPVMCTTNDTRENYYRRLPDSQQDFASLLKKKMDAENTYEKVYEKTAQKPDTLYLMPGVL